MIQTQLLHKQGDITKEQVDVIVNAANSSLLGGGGVDGAIHRAGGPAILEACRIIRNAQGKCHTGQAVITTAGQLSAKHVIHTVGPIWNGGTHNEHEKLAACYHNSLRLAQEHQARSIAFPAISTGIYAYPLAQAAEIATHSVRRFVEAFPESFDEIRFVLFTEDAYTVYDTLLREHKS